MYDTILVATDGSGGANRAVDHAIDLASTFDADLHAIYVVDTKRYGQSVVTDDGSVLEDLESRGETLLDEVETQSVVDVTRVVRSGRPSEEIGNYAAEINADLVILGNRGLGAGRDERIGSVAERVVRSVDRPVITA
ncbi:universal stress protein [Natrarchaeobius oligotrophus]|uniref:Universal stress protein n=1 Tax=Natrarchaeobius chitinivorans TaxID=1679083 RepID=A0A3N6P9P2_NATCH|nr:universal stress protein [Natrarchaeobius chitinivorans]RQG95659.1 universal stress protein [Natrarchaeobius chitinivorans]